MRFRIHFEWPSGTEDHIDLEGETIEAIRAQADQHMAARGIDRETCWSEPL